MPPLHDGYVGVAKEHDELLGVLRQLREALEGLAEADANFRVADRDFVAAEVQFKKAQFELAQAQYSVDMFMTTVQALAPEGSKWDAQRTAHMAGVREERDAG